jgi:predicted secreted hydrolase
MEVITDRDSRPVDKERQGMNKTGSICIFCFIFLILFSSNPYVFGQEYRDVVPDDTVKLPNDMYHRKEYRVQWWYFTGHLQDSSGREFGYELTFFVAGVQKREYRSSFGTNNIYISHFAISDVEGKRYFYADTADNGAFGFAGAEENRLNVWVGDDFLEGQPEEMRIRGREGNTWIDLRLVPAKKIVLNGVEGYSRKSEESALISSLYFSYTNMETEGSLGIAGSEFRVKGKSWFDREISSRGLGENYSGWDWFSLQLDDSREVMIYMIRKKDGSIDNFSSGTFVYPDGKYRRLRKDDFSVKILKHYTSKKTGARYPSQWKVTIPAESVEVTITPMLEDQEFLGTYSTWNYYWEGACRIEGTAHGKAYVEMTGY